MRTCLLLLSFYFSLCYLSSCGENKKETKKATSTFPTYARPISHESCRNIDTAFKYRNEVIRLLLGSSSKVEVQKLKALLKLEAVHLDNIGDEAAFNTILAALKGLPELNEINLSSASLSRLPDSLFLLTQIRRLHVDLDSLAIISPAISKLHQLGVFECDGIFNRLPKEFGSLDSIAFCSIHSHNLKSFPIELLRLKDLIFMSLRGSGIHDLPSELLKLPKLHSIDICHTPLAIYEEAYHIVFKKYDKIEKFHHLFDSELNFCGLNQKDFHTMDSISNKLMKGKRNRP